MVARSVSCRHSDSTRVGVRGMAQWVGGGVSGQGVRGSGPVGGGYSPVGGVGSSQGVGRLHYKVWTDAQMNATGF